MGVVTRGFGKLTSDSDSWLVARAHNLSSRYIEVSELHSDLFDTCHIKTLEAVAERKRTTLWVDEAFDP